MFLVELLADDDVGQHVSFFVPHLDEHSNTLATFVGVLLTWLDDAEKDLLGWLLSCDAQDLEANEQVGCVTHLLASIRRVAFVRWNRPNTRLAIACDFEIEVVYFLWIVSKDLERCCGNRIGELRKKRFIDLVSDWSIDSFAAGRNQRQKSNYAHQGC